MKKQITVKELREQLERLEEIGMSDSPVWFRDVDSYDHRIEEGIFDVYDGEVTIA